MSEGKEKFAYFKQVAIGAASGIATLALIIGGFSISGTASKFTSEPSASQSASTSSSPSASPTSSIARTCSVATLVADTRLANFSGVVINADTDEVLFDRKADATKGGALADAIGKGGGSVRIRKVDNTIQEERTIPPAKDPRKTKG